MQDLENQNKALKCRIEELECRLREAQERDERIIKMEQIKEVVRPLLDILRHEYDPHTTIIVQSDGVKIVQDEMYIPLK